MRELILMLAGENVRRIMENRFKPNSQLFEEYFAMVTVTQATSFRHEVLRVVGN